MIKHNALKTFLMLVSALLINSAFAGGSPATLIPGAAQSESTENRAYLGLTWAIKEKTSLVPDVTVGIRSLEVKSNDQVSGADLSARINLKDGISLDSTRLSYVGGERNILGNLGIGYSVKNATFLGTAAIQGPYSRLGSDYEFANKKFAPYLELLTLDKPEKLKEGGPDTYACPDDTTFLTNENTCEPEPN